MSPFAEDLLGWVRANDVQRIAKETTLTAAINTHFGGDPKGRKYPADCYSGRCDVVVPVDGLRWIEVKYAQMYFSQSDFRRDNRALFEKWVFSISMKEHSVRNDIVRKLSTLLGHSEVDYVGMLVIFLYSDLYPMPQDTFARLDELAPPSEWRKHALPAWENPDHTVIRSYVQPVYWERKSE